MADNRRVQIKLPPKLVATFTKPLGYYRYRCAYGGRGSAKSFTFAKMAAIFGYQSKLRILCTREYQVSIKQSFHAEIKNAIASEPWLTCAYDVGVDYIKGKNGTEFLFCGLQNMQNIKSMSQIDICIMEEAEDIDEMAWVDLEPTIRKTGSEVWVIWNPRLEGSPVDKRFIKNTPPRSSIIEMNYLDNPWFTEVLEEQRAWQQEIFDDAMYSHVWDGRYLKNSAAQIFKNKYEVADFEPGDDWDGPYYGIDFGFSQDPTAGVKCWVYKENLYIEYEGGKVGLELDDTAEYLSKHVPDIERYVSRADSARPESISYLKRHGLPRIVGVEKGKGSVEDGIEHIKSYRKTIIHPRCTETLNEFRMYSFKIDRLSKEVLTDIVDAFNHYIDAIRYALRPLMSRGKLNISAKTLERSRA